MSNEKRHGKIIEQLCKEMLIPLGVFQKGASRIYIDDNGYYFTVIEFQPSAWEVGTFLNISMHFLWKEQQYISYDFYVGDTSRVKDFISYQSDEQFTKSVKSYIEFAQERILFYRKFRDLEFVKEFMKSHPESPKIKELEKALTVYDEDMQEQIKRTRQFWHSKPMMKKLLK